MSELKEIGIRWEENGELHFSHVYRKSDVDSVIEEKDRAIEFAKALTLKDIEIIKEKDKEIAELKAENERLEEECRWRKCSEELPEVGVEVLVTNGIDCGISDWCGDYWNNDPFCGYTVCDDVIAWMPLPKAPEVE